jgi:hypothetical protein
MRYVVDACGRWRPSTGLGQGGLGQLTDPFAGRRDDVCLRLAVQGCEEYQGDQFKCVSRLYAICKREAYPVQSQMTPAARIQATRIADTACATRGMRLASNIPCPPGLIKRVFGSCERCLLPAGPDWPQLRLNPSEPPSRGTMYTPYRVA